MRAKCSVSVCLVKEESVLPLLPGEAETSVWDLKQTFVKECAL